MAQTLQLIDLWKEHKAIFSPNAGKPELVRVPPIKYLMIDGKGDPNTSAGFQGAIGAFYGLAYTLKFASRKERSVDFRVMPLSGLYHAADPRAFLEGHRKEWRWTLMIPVPSVVTAGALGKAMAEGARKRGAWPSLDAVRLETLKEGQAVQLLHLGPYEAEKPSIEKLHRFVAENGRALAGSHHEIYLSIPGKTRPERMKTIIRQPVKKAR